MCGLKCTFQIQLTSSIQKSGKGKYRNTCCEVQVGKVQTGFHAFSPLSLKLQDQQETSNMQAVFQSTRDRERIYILWSSMLIMMTVYLYITNLHT